MKKEALLSSLINSIGHELTRSQEVTAHLLTDFFVSKKSRQIFLLKGYAGTGKTTLIAACVRSLLVQGIKVVLLAPTGRAAKVLSQYSGYPAYTIHKWIYRQQSQKEALGRFVLNRNTSSNTIFIVDEGSMINNSSEDSFFGSGNVLEDLIQFIDDGDNCRLMIVGDEAQLPPIRLDISPALDKRVLESYGFDVTEITLNEVVRQAADSGVLSNATLIRTMISKNFNAVPKFQLVGFNDILKLSGAELIETLESSYSRVGVNETIVLNYSNKRANKYNQGIRNQILWREEELSIGDLLMVVRNNYFWVEKIQDINFIANGDIVEVVRIRKVRELHGFRFADVTVRLTDYQQQELDVMIMLDTLSLDGPSLPSDRSNQLFESVSLDYADIINKRNKLKKIKEDPYFNALQVKFAYAVTCHKAQGGQWKHVYIDQGFFRDDMISKEYLRWLYTALTRATERVYLVNFAKEFFTDEFS
ncbi:MAG: AAA family ATPase [Tenuifilaceae bacterium]|jgi:exodeoxyribonuclease-5|nr:AAA family ATPase [Tenuifilaceae bacterium]